MVHSSYSIKLSRGVIDWRPAVHFLDCRPLFVTGVERVLHEHWQKARRTLFENGNHVPFQAYHFITTPMWFQCHNPAVFLTLIQHGTLHLAVRLFCSTTLINMTSRLLRPSILLRVPGARYLHVGQLSCHILQGAFR